ncbi:cutinase-domain-containing protein [Plectosphaerella plurivora]|uniref:Cutinase-domain-containing protein n=1 Tax=Plectosphaerella plurivora TaxID=936078 RepID=A0A9P8V9J6_9PEZI|nr:cutinase-domain-containing protein [Plectosphaerella plurivora]
MLAYSLLASGLLAAGAAAAAVEARQECPPTHLFSVGSGAIDYTVEQLLLYYPETTVDVVTYGASVSEGTAGLATAINDFHSNCPSTKLVLLGNADGARLVDNAVCAGPDVEGGIFDDAPFLTDGALNATRSIVLYGDPRFRFDDENIPNIAGCSEHGPAARQLGSKCPAAAGKARHYCESVDAGCCVGCVEGQPPYTDYESVYANDAIDFVLWGLYDEEPEEPTPTPSPTPTSTVVTTTRTTSTGPTPTGPECRPLWAQCGGVSWTGATCCQQGNCLYLNTWHSQCLMPA